MAYIELTQGQRAQVDDDMFPFLARWKWQYSGKGYAVRGLRRGPKYRNVFLHQVVACMLYGYIPDGYYVDHLDGNRLICTTANIRLATRQENGRNMKPIAHSSQYKGVHWSKSHGKWGAQISVNRKHIYLGFHEDERLAAERYDSKARELFGEFACCNFPEAT
jgi:hypothetical protein